MSTASELAFFWTGSTSVAAQRSMYYRFEKKHLLGAFKHCGTIAARRSTTQALIWAEETKGLEEQLVKLAAANLQLQELAEALIQSKADQAIAMPLLNRLLDASREKMAQALFLGSSD